MHSTLSHVAKNNISGGATFERNPKKQIKNYKNCVWNFKFPKLFFECRLSNKFCEAAHKSVLGDVLKRDRFIDLSDYEVDFGPRQTSYFPPRIRFRKEKQDGNGTSRRHI